MKNWIKLVIISVVLSIIIYLLWSWMNSKSTAVTSSVVDATKPTIVNAKSLDPATGTQCTYSVWVKVDDWNYHYGKKKDILVRTNHYPLTTTDMPSPRIYLGETTNDLMVSLETYPVPESINNGLDPSGGGIIYASSEIRAGGFPLQKWTHVVVTISNRLVDIYVDGKLARNVSLTNIPNLDHTSNLLITPGGGFSGLVADVQFIANYLNPEDVGDLYRKGFSGSSNSWLGPLAPLFDKYKVKLSFLKDGQVDSSLTF